MHAVAKFSRFPGRTFGVNSFFAVACVLLVGCVGPNRSASEEPLGTLFAEIRLTTGAYSGLEKARTGFVFYLEENERIAGPRLTGYQYKCGELVKIFGGGSDSTGVVATLRQVGLRPFDFAAEVESCVARQEADAKARGEKLIPPFALDGAEYEIVIATPAGPFRMKEWNPGFAIDQYSSCSPDIANLKRTLDLLAQYYGHLEFGI